MTPTLCIICGAGGARACGRCQACHYCSTQCQEQDWPSHKILCSSVRRLPPRPGPNHRLAIWFPSDAVKPQLVWIRTTPLTARNEPGLIAATSYIGNQPWIYENVQLNPRSGAISEESVRLVSRSPYNTTVSRRCESLVKSAELYGPLEKDYSGPMIAMVATFDVELFPSTGSSYTDITLDHFRLIIDWASHYHRGNAEYRTDWPFMDNFGCSFVGESLTKRDDYGSHPGCSIRVPPPIAQGSIIHGVKVRRELARGLNEKDMYEPISIAASSDIFRMPAMMSQISQLVEIPIVGYKDWDITQDSGWSNSEGCQLFCIWTPAGTDCFGFAPSFAGIQVGDMLLFRQDGNALGALDAHTLVELTREARNLAQIALEELYFETSDPTPQQIAASHRKVLNYITPENFAKAKERVYQKCKGRET